MPNGNLASPFALVAKAPSINCCAKAHLCEQLRAGTGFLTTDDEFAPSVLGLGFSSVDQKVEAKAIAKCAHHTPRV